MTPNGNVLSVQLVNVKSVNGGKGFSQQTKSSGVDSLDALPGNGLHSGLSPDGSGSAPHTLTHANGFQKVREYNVISPPPFLPPLATALPHHQLKTPSHWPASERSHSVWWVIPILVTITD